MDLEAEIARLETLSSSELGERWRRLVRSPVPKVGSKMLRLALAWEIQAAALGGLPRSLTAALDQLERGLTKTATPAAGMRLVREWGGKVHVVTVVERGSRMLSVLTATTARSAGTAASGEACRRSRARLPAPAGRARILRP